MFKKTMFGILIFLISSVLILSGKAYAYIDPGTTGAIFSSITFIFAAIATAIGFLFWPIKKLYYVIKGKFSSSEK